VVRLYWTKKPDSASRLFAQEMGAMSIRDVLSEDRWAVEAGQRGIGRDTIEQVHFQDHEMLLRHLYETVQEKVAEYLAEQEAA
jgi:hypothetical protein